MSILSGVRTRFEAASDIPIVVESVKRDIFFSMTRCNYFAVECDTPHIGWQLGLGPASFPFLMLGLVGIIQQPFGAARFETPRQIEDLFTRIEDEAGLLVEIEDIWFPNFLFKAHDSNPPPGTVYRAKNGLFSAAFLFREGRADSEHFLAHCRELDGAIAFSEKETKCFAAWHDQQVLGARRQYPKNAAFKLSWH